MPEFKVGDVVEIHAGNLFNKWEGKRGVITEISDDTTFNATHPTIIHVNCFDLDGVIGGWFPESLTLIDNEAEARAVLGDGYFE